MRTVRNSTKLFLVTGALAASGCAAAMPPQDLLTARSTYAEATKGPAPEFDPADMHSAREQLDLAEATFVRDGDTQDTRDQAYVAVRKTELAESVARTLRSNQSKDRVVSAMHDEEKSAVARTSAALGRTQTQLAASDVALGDETSRRQDAEKKLAQAMADIAKFASVKQEPRGMVITLSGGVLFASSKWDLLPSAQVKLNDVATALIKNDPVSKMVVEGYTDSQGGSQYNQELSQHRAEAVREYLLTRGIASDRIVAEGFGLTRPIADNTSPEGRANNRRVEIVVQPPAVTR